LAVVPAAWILYEASKKNAAGEEPYLTQLMRKLDYMQDVYHERNILHAHLAEQAAADRILFAHSEVAPQRRRVSVGNLEYVLLGPSSCLTPFFRTINGYCPHNVQPGWGSINLEKLVEHVKQENEEQERKNMERMQKRLVDEAAKN
jgi:hypothetical protein